jgi:WD40 repeat protein
MPELQEVFRMATQKVDQDDGALERQVTKQRRAARNRQVGAFATVAAFIAIAVGVFALTRGDTGGAPAVSPSIPPVTPGMATGSTVDVVTGKITPLPASIGAAGTFYAVSPDKTIAFNACCAQPGPIMTANVDWTQVQPLTPQGWDAYGAQWSPDGSQLVYQQRQASTEKLGNLFVQDVRTGQRTQITNFDQTQAWGWWFTFPSFAADGQSILFQLPRGNPDLPVWDLWSVPVAGGQQTLVRRNAGWGGYAPNGKQLAYLAPMDPNTFSGGALWVGNADGGKAQALVHSVGLTWPRWSPDGTRISYSDAGSIYVLNVATGATTQVARGGNAEWFDDHTLIVGNPTN